MLARAAEAGATVPVLRAGTGTFFEGASSGRRFTGLSAPRTGPNTPIIASGATLTDRTYALVRNEPFVGRALDALCVGIIGLGITPQLEVEDEELQAAHDVVWDQFVDEMDADGVTDGYGQQVMLVRDVLSGGDGFWRFRPRLAGDRAPFMPVPLAVPMQVQSLGAEMCPRELNETLANGEIIAGIEFDAIGRKVAYRMFRKHPFESGALGGFGGGDTVRVPAEVIAHAHEIGRSGQVRGVPRCGSVILPAHDFHQGEDALQKAWNLESVLWGAIEWINDDPAILSDAERDEYQKNPTGTANAQVNVGDVHVLRPGQQFKRFEPPDVGSTYGVATEVRLRRMAAGLRVPYETLSGDMKAVTYSSLRVGMLDFWASCDQFLWHTIIPQAIRPLWLTFFDTAVRAGRFPMLPLTTYLRDPRKYLRVSFITPKRPWIDPLKDVQGELLAIEGGILSRDESIRARGGIPGRVDRSRQISKRRAEKMGITDGKAPTVAPAANDTPTDEKPQQNTTAPATPANRKAA